MTPEINAQLERISKAMGKVHDAINQGAELVRFIEESLDGTGVTGFVPGEAMTRLAYEKDVESKRWRVMAGVSGYGPTPWLEAPIAIRVKTLELLPLLMTELVNKAEKLLAKASACAELRAEQSREGT